VEVYSTVVQNCMYSTVLYVPYIIAGVRGPAFLFFSCRFNLGPTKAMAFPSRSNIAPVHNIPSSITLIV
jgi:hypothetical protein